VCNSVRAYSSGGQRALPRRSSLLTAPFRLLSRRCLCVLHFLNDEIDADVLGSARDRKRKENASGVVRAAKADQMEALVTVLGDTTLLYGEGPAVYHQFALSVGLEDEAVLELAAFTRYMALILDRLSHAPTQSPLLTLATNYWRSLTSGISKPANKRGWSRALALKTFREKLQVSSREERVDAAIQEETDAMFAKFRKNEEKESGTSWESEGEGHRTKRPKRYKNTKQGRGSDFARQSYTSRKEGAGAGAPGWDSQPNRARDRSHPRTPPRRTSGGGAHDDYR
jgi:hypothetical protein